MNYIEHPSEQLLKAWHFVCCKENFITPAQIANVAQMGHEAATDCLRQWLEQGVLEHTPRYPDYVYSCTQNWQRTAIAQRLNQLISTNA